MIQCALCERWIHAVCADVSGEANVLRDASFQYNSLMY